MVRCLRKRQLFKVIYMCNIALLKNLKSGNTKLDTRIVGICKIMHNVSPRIWKDITKMTNRMKFYPSPLSPLYWFSEKIIPVTDYIIPPSHAYSSHIPLPMRDKPTYPKIIAFERTHFSEPFTPITGVNNNEK